MKATAAELLRHIPGKVTEKWPAGERFVSAFAHGSMSVEFYAPIVVDPQTPHDQDELYVIHSGSGDFLMKGDRYSFAVGEVFLVTAGTDHRFENFTEDFSTWVVFWGPKGGDRLLAQEL